MTTGARECAILQSRHDEFYAIPIEDLEGYRLSGADVDRVKAELENQQDVEGFADNTYGSVSKWASFKEGVYLVAYKMFWA